VSDHWHHCGPHHTVRFVFEPSMTGDDRVAVGLIRLYQVTLFGFASLPTMSDAARQCVVGLFVRREPSGKWMAIGW
jgi:hypothetical protein